MQPITSTTPVMRPSAPATAPVAAPAPAAAPTPAPAAPKAASVDVLGGVGDALRGVGAGMSATSREQGTIVDKAAIVPFEAAVTVTGELKKATSNVKGVSKVTSILHTITGFGMLIGAMTVSSLFRTPGDVAVSLTHQAADLIDGKQTAAEATKNSILTP